MNVKPADELIDLAQDVFIEVWDNRVELSSLQRSNLERELEKISIEIDEYVKRVGKTKDDVLISVYENKIKELVKKKEELKGQLSYSLYTDKNFGTALEKVFNTLKNPLSMWKSDEYSDKRTILFMYFEEQLRYDYYNGFGTVGLAYPIKLISEIGASNTPSVEMSSYELESKNLH